VRGKKANTKEPENIFSLSELQGDETVDINMGFAKLDEFLNELKEKDFEDKYAIMVDVEYFFRNITADYEKKLTVSL